MQHYLPRMLHLEFERAWTIVCPKCRELAFSDKAKDLPPCPNCDGEYGVCYVSVYLEGLRGAFVCKACGQKSASFAHSCGCFISANCVKYSSFDEMFGPCFVATATMNDENHPVVVSLRWFRDNYLVRYYAGRMFIQLYWRVGPCLAETIVQYPVLKILSYYLLIKPAFIFVTIYKHYILKQKVII